MAYRGSKHNGRHAIVIIAERVLLVAIAFLGTTIEHLGQGVAHEFTLKVGRTAHHPANRTTTVVNESTDVLETESERSFVPRPDFDDEEVSQFREPKEPSVGEACSEFQFFHD